MGRGEEVHAVITPAELPGKLGYGHQLDQRDTQDRQLGELTSEPAIGDFDVSRSGDEIVFDRVEKSSEIALIERAH